VSEEPILPCEETNPARPSPALIFAALAKARGEFPEIQKTRVATVKSEKAQYSYKYADLSDVFNAIDPILSAHGLTVMQFPTGSDLMTIVAHESGAEVCGRWPIKPMKGQDLGNAQAFQAAVQVAKRYALTAILGISTEETVEGDMRRKASWAEGMNEAFETGDGTRMPKGAKFTKSMTPREKAQEAARAIEAQFREVKTGAGLIGAWDRNSAFIDLLAEKHDDLYQNVIDVYSAETAKHEPSQDDE
jgi:hypothetical protein